ncbi:uncharacterized protein FIBRA_02611 [Fibroporia radiculosa]|uniref:Uncharacterized protein n=1 Tax=Fibroporia radiculosa TaxID=599839 RepID=J4I956_9APHY|nr:uncharacterized protein FIBRA_02611 [Fibroporia radiculosa]CCM00576.1 predicted protein [Fibroporia radiculosa]
MSHRYNFVDPFLNASDFQAPAERVAVPSPYAAVPSKDEVDNLTHAVPLVIKRGSDSSVATLPIEGQGTIAVSTNAKAGLRIAVNTPDSSKPTLFLDVTTDHCGFSYGKDSVVLGSTPTPIPAVALKGIAACYLLPDQQTTYWLSVDRPNGVIRYGKYYLSTNLALLEATLKVKNDQGVMVWSDPKWNWLDDLKNVVVTQVGGDETKRKVAVQPLPLVNDLPPYIAPSDAVSMSDLETGVCTVVGNLPPECQRLYANVAGPNILLNTPDFPDFGAAIEHSVNTKGCLGYKLLEKKADEFGKKDFTGTYLRITIGRDMGDSPGIPYVLEIWPAGHYSPIHDHGDAFAVIKVLYGSIHVYYFDSLDPPGPQHIANPAVLKAGDITWLSSQQYQIHQLRNESPHGAVCCTLQCYQYGKDDSVHYEYFRYKSTDPKGEKKDFQPNSDMPFGEFKRAIAIEWEKYKSGQGP